MRTKRIVAATFLVWLLAAYAQQPQQTPRTPVVQQPNAPLQKPAYKFEAEAQLVVLNVSAKDKSGNPVEGLKASRFHGHRGRQAAADQGLRVPEAGRDRPARGGPAGQLRAAPAACRPRRRRASRANHHHPGQAGRDQVQG